MSELINTEAVERFLRPYAPTGATRNDDDDDDDDERFVFY